MTTPLSDFQKWARWNRMNPDFYGLFRDYALEVVAAGMTKVSGWLIVNRIRWETEVVTRGSGYKIPNGCIAYYTRLFVAEFPHHSALFERRPMKTPLPDGAFEGVLEDMRS